MTSSRRDRLAQMGFHNIRGAASSLSSWFDIDIRARIAEAKWNDVVVRFCRRRVYEHQGGEADERYLRESGDTAVSLKQRIYESRAGIHSLLNSLVKMAKNLHRGFHELFPQDDEPIRSFQERQ